MQRMAVKDVMKLKHRQTIKIGSPLALSLAAAPEEEEEEEVLGNPSPSLLLAILLSVLLRKIRLDPRKWRRNRLWLGLENGVSTMIKIMCVSDFQYYCYASFQYRWFLTCCSKASRWAVGIRVSYPLLPPPRFPSWFDAF